MRKFLVVVLLACVILLSGCINTLLVEAVRSHTNVILPEYKEYVSRDAFLDPETRAIRISSAEALEKLLNEAAEATAINEGE